MNRNDLPKIEQVIGASTELKQVGSDLIGWHRVHPSSSKTSLHVDPQKQIYYCFHCGQGGDVIDWVGFALFGDSFDRRKDFKAILKAIEEGRVNTVPVSFDPPPPQEVEVFDSSIYMKYHEQVQREYWYKELGDPKLIDPAIEHFKLGFCEHNPKNGYPSHTIPIFMNGECVNIRHRVIGGEAKYLPHKSGLGAHLFNYDILPQAREAKKLLIVAGEKKVISAWAHGVYEVVSPTIGCSFKEEWIPLVKDIPRIYILFDPGEEKQAAKVGVMLNATVLSLPAKLDDFLRDGGTVRDVFSQLNTPMDELYWLKRTRYKIRKLGNG
jgi:DNA primase